MSKSRFAFVLMPFSAEFDDAYRLGIKEAADACGVQAERVDEQQFVDETILERIYGQIDAADFVIADMTDQNPNVFYEVGYAHAKKKPCILLTQRAEDIPFDLKHRRHIVYNKSITALRTRLTREIEWMNEQLDAASAAPVEISLVSASGSLSKGKLVATGTVSFSFDLHNRSSGGVVIAGFYVYTRDVWEVIQDERTCSRTASDLPESKLRHLLQPPLPVLPYGGWAQLRFKMKRKWHAHDAALKDSYTVSGRLRLRMILADKHFDYQFNLDVTCEDVPF